MFFNIVNGALPCVLISYAGCDLLCHSCQAFVMSKYTPCSRELIANSNGALMLPFSNTWIRRYIFLKKKLVNKTKQKPNT